MQNSDKGVFDRVEYIGQEGLFDNIATVIYFKDGRSFVIKQGAVSIPYARGTKIKVELITEFLELGTKVRITKTA